MRPSSPPLSASVAPVAQTPVRKLDLAIRRLLDVLRHQYERKKDPAAPALLREEQAIALVNSIGPNLVDLAAQMSCDLHPVLLHVLHRTSDLCRISVRELLDELLDRSAAGGGPVIAPAVTHGQRRERNTELAALALIHREESIRVTQVPLNAGAGL